MGLGLRFPFSNLESHSLQDHVFRCTRAAPARETRQVSRVWVLGAQHVARTSAWLPGAMGESLPWESMGCTEGWLPPKQGHKETVQKKSGAVTRRSVFAVQGCLVM